MSRIGRMPVQIPAGCEIGIEDCTVTVKGPKGTLNTVVPAAMVLEIEGDVLTVKRPSDSREHRSLHGLTRTLVANMVEGVSQGFIRNLEIHGVGYRANLQGDNLELALGFSHPVVIKPPEGVSFELVTPTRVRVHGIDKQKVGQVAANIRSLRKPDPYKGKGIRYAGEHVRKKAGKSTA
jgi:large subunit ribosomal protein L6